MDCFKNISVTFTGRQNMCSCLALNSTIDNLSCSVEYADMSGLYPLHPIITWTKDGNVFLKTEEPVPQRIDSYTFRSTSILTISASDTSTYLCIVNFSAPTDNRLFYIARNAPSFSSSCSITSKYF